MGGANAQDLWGRALANDPSSVWDPTEWMPHAVVIHLGTNDLCCGHNITHDEFIGSYAGFVQRIAAARAAVQTAPIPFVLGCGPMGNSKGNVDETGRSFWFPCSVVEKVASAV